MKTKKDTRIEIRIDSYTKKKFYDLCEKHGLCPSIIMNRWIKRFITHSKKNKINFEEVYSATTERMVEYDEYMKS